MTFHERRAESAASEQVAVEYLEENGWQLRRFGWDETFQPRGKVRALISHLPDYVGLDPGGSPWLVEVKSTRSLVELEIGREALNVLLRYSDDWRDRLIIVVVVAGEARGYVTVKQLLDLEMAGKGRCGVFTSTGQPYVAFKLADLGLSEPSEKS